MGGEPHDPNAGDAPACAGNDVLEQLNDVFGTPGSASYQRAQANNTFGTVGTDYLALITAYEQAGLQVNGRWKAYLRKLGSAVPQGPTNISTIAQFRDTWLKQSRAMSTITHEPQHGGHVYTKPDPGGAAVIDSPLPMP